MWPDSEIQQSNGGKRTNFQKSPLLDGIHNNIAQPCDDAEE
ncbi:MAG TPA: hypothetical protein VF600_00390 [Abditibacteriaceae bacterium]|jgi:hypothetical protein